MHESYVCIDPIYPIEGPWTSSRALKAAWFRLKLYVLEKDIEIASGMNRAGLEEDFECATW